MILHMYIPADGTPEPMVTSVLVHWVIAGSYAETVGHETGVVALSCTGAVLVRSRSGDSRSLEFVVTDVQDIHLMLWHSTSKVDQRSDYGSPISRCRADETVKASYGDWSSGMAHFLFSGTVVGIKAR